jgi:hypothetical protein
MTARHLISLMWLEEMYDDDDDDDDGTEPTIPTCNARQCDG